MWPDHCTVCPKIMETKKKKSISQRKINKSFFIFSKHIKGYFLVLLCWNFELNPLHTFWDRATFRVACQEPFYPISRNRWLQQNFTWIATGYVQHNSWVPTSNTSWHSCKCRNYAVWAMHSKLLLSTLNTSPVQVCSSHKCMLLQCVLSDHLYFLASHYIVYSLTHFWRLSYRDWLWFVT